MHDPQFGLGMDTRVHLWHPCKVEVHETSHNDVDWVDLRFMRQVNVCDNEGRFQGRSQEQVEVQVRREAAKDLMCRLLELFPVEAGALTFTMRDVHIREREESCQGATAEEH